MANFEQDFIDCVTFKNVPIPEGILQTAEGAISLLEAMHKVLEAGDMTVGELLEALVAAGIISDAAAATIVEGGTTIAAMSAAAFVGILAGCLATTSLDALRQMFSSNDNPAPEWLASAMDAVGPSDQTNMQA